MRGLTRLVLSHPRLVTLFWLLLAAVGGALAPRTVDALSYEFALPGEPAYEANEAILERFGTGGPDVDPLVLVATGDGAEQAVVRVAEQAAGAVEGTRVVTAADRGAEALVAGDGATAVALMYPPPVPGPEPYAEALPAVEQVVAEAGAGDGPSVGLTGVFLLEESSSGGDRGVLIEILLGAGGALIVLALVFGSLLAGVPLLVAAIAIPTTFLALLGLTQLTDVVFVVQFLIGLIGLGVAIDYSLLVVMRWREERSRGQDSAEAIRIAMATAGRSVLFSGVTVAVSLAALVAVPLPFLRSIGLAGLLIPLVSVAVSLTLVPALLAGVGDRLQWPRRRATDPRSRLWARIAGFSCRHPVWVTVASTAVLVAMALPVLGLRLGSPEVQAYDSETSAGAAADRIVAAGIPIGVLRPLDVLSTDSQGAIDALADVEGVTVSSPEGEGWSRGDDVLLQVWTDADPSSATGDSAVTAAREALDGVAEVGGSPAEDADFVAAVYGNVPLVVGLVVLVTMLLLARALRSLWLPLKALVLNVLSLAAAFGLTVLVWQEGIGTEAVFGTSSSGVITTWVPVAAFAFLFGLSMDYEVFILARIRESYDESGSTQEAVIDGIARTGRLVTSAALILFLAFVALSTTPSTEVKILATTLALGIAIDAVIVRGLLAPALVVLLGRANWYLPRWLGRVLLVTPDRERSRM